MDDSKHPWLAAFQFANHLSQVERLQRSTNTGSKTKKKPRRMLALRRELKRLHIAFEWSLYNQIRIIQIPYTRPPILIGIEIHRSPGQPVSLEYFSVFSAAKHLTLKTPATSVSDLLRKLVQFGLLNPTEIFPQPKPNNL